MRRATVGLSCAIFGILAAPAYGQWGAPVTVPGATTNPIEVGFDVNGQGLLRWGDAAVARSLDSGGSWGAPSLYPSGSDVEVGSDAQSNRVWAWSGGGKIRVVRTGPEGGPATPGYKEIASGALNDLELAVNAAGDALIAWTNNSGDAGAAFWAAGAAAPGAPQTLTTGSSSTSTPIPILDAGHSAAVVFTGANNGGKTFQAVAADAALPNAFATPTQLAVGTVTRGGQGPDGRALVVIRDTPTIPANPYGQTNTLRYLLASRAPGGAFGVPAVLSGDSARLVSAFATTLPIAPNGRTLLGFQTNVNRPGGQTCGEAIGQAHTELATGTIDAAGLVSLTGSTVSDSGNTGGMPFVAAGPDGRLAAIWNELTACGPPSVSVMKASFAPAGAGFSPIAAPPFFPVTLAFTGTGSLYDVGYPATGPFKGVAYDTGLPLALPTATPTPTPTATATPEPTATAAPEPAVPTPRPTVTTTVTPGLTAKLGKVTTVKDGSLKLAITTSGAGKLTLTAKAGKTTVAKATKSVKRAGTVTVALKPIGKPAKTLRTKRKLSATLTIAFKPATGTAPAPVKRTITFRRS